MKVVVLIRSKLISDRGVTNIHTGVYSLRGKAAFNYINWPFFKYSLSKNDVVDNEMKVVNQK